MWLIVQSAGTRRKANLTPRNIGRSICACCTWRGCEAPASRYAGIADRRGHRAAGRNADTVRRPTLGEEHDATGSSMRPCFQQGHGAR